MRAALYARVSTDEQREESLEDQLRECRELCHRHGFEVVKEFTDFALSGNASDRPAYKDLLKLARAKRLDVIVAHELSRLWRNEAELHTIKEELEYLDVQVVTDDGIDTRSANMDVLIAVKGTMAKQELRQIAHRTHRALKGLVMAGKSAGGKCYGYVPATKAKSGTREVDPEQARWVLWIFQHYADGWSPRRIADELNRLQVPSPGASWKRTTRRHDGKWLASTIYGDPKHGSGILNNELYTGRYVWNRRRSKKRFKSGEREFHARPQAEWVPIELPHLRIVPQELWEQAHARMRRLRGLVGTKVREGLSAAAAGGHAGAVQRGPKYLFSGLLRCGCCQSNYVVSGTNQGYVCSSHTHGGSNACANGLRVSRAKVEERLLAAIKNDLLSDEGVACFAEDMREELRLQRADVDQEQALRLKRVNHLKGEIQNLTDAIAGGALRHSPAIAARLGQCEAELAKAEQELALGSAEARKVIQLLPRVAEQYRRLVAGLPDGLGGSIREARRDVAALLGGVVEMVPDDTRTHLVAHLALSRQAFTLKCMGARANTGSGSGGRI